MMTYNAQQTQELAWLLERTFDPEKALQLIKAGANPHITNSKGDTLLHWCCKFDRTYLPQFLPYKINVNAKNNAGKTVADLLIKYPHLHAFTLLLLMEHGLDPNTRDANGDTLLMHHLHNFPCVINLLKLGTDPRIANNAGKTALAILLRGERLSALFNDFMKIGIALVAYGANSNTKNHEGKTLADYIKHYHKLTLIDYVNQHCPEFLPVDKTINEARLPILNFLLLLAGGFYNDDLPFPIEIFLKITSYLNLDQAKVNDIQIDRLQHFIFNHYSDIKAIAKKDKHINVCYSQSTNKFTLFRSITTFRFAKADHIGHKVRLKYTYPCR